MAAANKYSIPYEGAGAQLSLLLEKASGHKSGGVTKIVCTVESKKYISFEVTSNANEADVAEALESVERKDGA